MKNLIFLVVLVFSYELCMAQDTELTFRSSELQSTAKNVSGNTQHWPVLLKLADHNVAENTFTLNTEDLLILRNLSELHLEIEAQKILLQKLIRSGGSIFADAEVKVVETLLSNYQNAIKKGDINLVFEIGNNIPPAVKYASDILESERIADIEAQIERKQGEVSRRKGLLGEWLSAGRGDLLEQSDGIRTEIKSYANLAFADGSALKINPSTTAVIRKSRIDRLSENTDTEITLENGGVLAQLSQAGKERSNYILNAGSSSTELQSRNFYAETDSNDTVFLTNYDGTANVNSNDVVITIGKNEGTVVEKGKSPLPPRKLLASPSIPWSESDTVISTDRLLFQYNPVDKAVRYAVQISTDINFQTDNREQVTTETQLLIDDISDGITYIKVQAIDELGLRSPYSNTVRILRSQDNKPPPVFINGAEKDLLFTQKDRLTVTGVTEPKVEFMVSGKKIAVSPSGKFSFTLTDLYSEHPVEIKLKDRSGNTTTKNIRVIRLQEDKLYAFSTAGASGKDPILYSQNSITLSGTSYPGLSYIIENGPLLKEIKTDNTGKWGITIYPRDGYLSISVKKAESDTLLFSKNFRIQSD